MRAAGQRRKHYGPGLCISGQRLSGPPGRRSGGGRSRAEAARKGSTRGLEGMRNHRQIDETIVKNHGAEKRDCVQKQKG